MSFEPRLLIRMGLRTALRHKTNILVNPMFGFEAGNPTGELDDVSVSGRLANRLPVTNRLSE